jgi:hypothetical protein
LQHGDAALQPDARVVGRSICGETEAPTRAAIVRRVLTEL